MGCSATAKLTAASWTKAKMYLSSFIHRDHLFDIAERWLLGRLEADDGLRVTQILICDGFVLGQTLEAMVKLLLELMHGEIFKQKRI